MLYAAPTWAEAATRTRANRNRTYRTVSAEAVHVLVSLPPGDLLAEEATKIQEDIDRGLTRKDPKAKQREETASRWKGQWEASQKGEWTRSLIPEIKKWTARDHGQLSYCLTQLFTGHGCFASFLHRIGKLRTDACEDCTLGVRDTAEHTLTECPAWEERRDELKAVLGATPTPASLVDAMLRDRRAWDAVQHFAEEVLGEKDQRQRRRQREPDSSNPAR